MGTNLTVTNTAFEVADGVMSSTSYFITVDSASLTDDMVLTFSNCNFTVAGNVFLVPGNVRLVFDNCTFNVMSTVILFNLDYSTDCPDAVKFGRLQISSSVF
jgi:hypothetical protein